MNKLFFLILIVASFANAGTKVNTIPNQYGWVDSNCAHIMADGHCAHPIGTNVMEITTPKVWDASNCAHIMANGDCAHPL